MTGDVKTRGVGRKTRSEQCCVTVQEEFLLEP